MTVWEFMRNFKYYDFTIHLADGREFKLRYSQYHGRELEFDYIIELIMECQVGWVDFGTNTIYPSEEDQYFDNIVNIQWNAMERVKLIKGGEAVV